jgi:hypothetical protein
MTFLFVYLEHEPERHSLNLLIGAELDQSVFLGAHKSTLLL